MELAKDQQEEVEEDYWVDDESEEATAEQEPLNGLVFVQ